jgi:hypothetical protein
MSYACNLESMSEVAVGAEEVPGPIEGLRASQAVVESLHKLSDRNERRAVVKAISRIGRQPGEPLGDVDGHDYWVMVPDDSASAPVVVYEDLKGESDQPDALRVIALLKRGDYTAIRRWANAAAGLVGPVTSPVTGGVVAAVAEGVAAGVVRAIDQTGRASGASS